MPCVLSWSLRDWFHLFPSNLALSSSKYDKLRAETIILCLAVAFPGTQPALPCRASGLLLCSLWFHQSQGYYVWRHFLPAKQGVWGAVGCRYFILWENHSVVSDCTVTSNCEISSINLVSTILAAHFFQLKTSWTCVVNPLLISWT